MGRKDSPTGPISNQLVYARSEGGHKHRKGKRSMLDVIVEWKSVLRHRLCCFTECARVRVRACVRMHM